MRLARDQSSHICNTRQTCLTNMGPDGLINQHHIEMRQADERVQRQQKGGLLDAEEHQTGVLSKSTGELVKKIEG